MNYCPAHKKEKRMMFQKFRKKQLIKAGVELCQISHEARAKGVEPVVPPKLKAKIARLQEQLARRSSGAADTENR